MTEPSTYKGNIVTSYLADTTPVRGRGSVTHRLHGLAFCSWVVLR